MTDVVAAGHFGRVGELGAALALKGDLTLAENLRNILARRLHLFFVGIEDDSNVLNVQTDDGFEERHEIQQGGVFGAVLVRPRFDWNDVGGVKFGAPRLTANVQNLSLIHI